MIFMRTVFIYRCIIFGRVAFVKMSSLLWSASKYIFLVMLNFKIRFIHHTNLLKIYTFYLSEQVKKVFLYLQNYLKLTGLYFIYLLEPELPLNLFSLLNLLLWRHQDNEFEQMHFLVLPAVKKLIVKNI